VTLLRKAVSLSCLVFCQAVFWLPLEGDGVCWAKLIAFRSRSERSVVAFELANAVFLAIWRRIMRLRIGGHETRRTMAH